MQAIGYRKPLRFLLWLCCLSFAIGTMGSSAEAQTTTFRVKHIEAEGNTRLSAAELQRVLGGYENRDLTLADLQKAAEALQADYRKRGYFVATVVVPQQDVTSGGTARLQVFEGKIGDIHVEGNKHYSTALIQSYLETVKRLGVLSSQTFQRALLLLDDLPDMAVKSVLTPGKTVGTTDVTLKVEDADKLHGSLSYDNFGNNQVGQNHAIFGLWKGNLTGTGDVLSFQSVNAFPTNNNMPFIQANFTTPTDSDGTRVGASYSNGDFTTNPQGQLVDIRGTASILTVLASHALRRSLNDTSDVTVSYSTKSLQNQILGSNNSHDEVREIAAGFNATWQSSDARNFLAVGLTNGLGGLFGGSTASNPHPSRAGANDSFTRANLDLARIQKLGPLYLMLRGSLQWTPDPLVVAEQFSLGGADSVRGYPQSEFLGDSGYTISAELRLPVDKAERYQLAAFVDHGEIWQTNPVFGERGSQYLTGAGVGARANLDAHTFLRLDLGFPIAPSPNSVKQDPVIYGQVTYNF